MKRVNDHSARILRHGERADEITSEAIAVRARELALIDGRSAKDVTEEDRRTALAELRGEHLPEGAGDDSEAVPGLTRDPSEPLSVSGRQMPNQNEPEDQDVQERLVLEGVEEAQHDQMLAARRRREL